MIFTNPSRFFEERLKREVHLGIPALIVVVSGALSGISTFQITNKMMESMIKMQAMSEIGGGIFASVISFGTIVSAIIVFLLIWLLIAAIFHGISAIFGGKGAFKRTLEFVGYGHTPMIFAGMINAALVHELLSAIPPPKIPAGAGLEDIGSIIQAWSMELASHPLSVLSSAIGIIFVLWCANIWVFAVKHARGLTTKNALITVIVPVGAYIAYSILQLLLLLV